MTDAASSSEPIPPRFPVGDGLGPPEQQFRLLVEGVTDYAIFMLDPDGRVASWNAGARRIKGYAPEEILGQHFSRFYTEADRLAGLPQTGLDTARREGRWEHEGVRLRKDGQPFFAHVVIDAIRDDAGRTVGFAKITRDVSERRASERALAEAREALFQAQKLDALGQLTGGLAHDFNNLLMAVLGSLELLKKRLPYDPKITPLVDNAIQGAERGASLTERLLAFARREPLQVAAVDVPELARGILGFLQRAIGPTIRLEARFPTGLPLAATDPNQLENALLNLVVNARDAMPEGGLVTISARRERVTDGHAALLRPGDYVVLQVSDTGAGMDDATRTRALDPFFTTKGVGKGTGLGLSMVHGLAIQCGGRVAIRTAPAEGTTVELWLAAAGESAVASAGEDGPGNQRVVLVVDDDFLVLSNTVALLEDLGHRVLEASSGAEALEILRRAPDLDLLVTDYAMPGMNGAELRRAALELRPDLPALFVTGYANLPGGEGLPKPFLKKPFTQHQLADAVDKLLDRQTAAA